MPPTTLSARLSLTFSCLGHAYMHLFAAFFFVIVLALEREWSLPYHDVIELWTLGALLIGVCAIPAGWLGDRWSTPGMMVVMFIGMGAAAIGCGLATTPTQMLWGLSALGVFAAIYHPVAIAWVVRNARARGKALGINGIFGSIGVAASGAVTGLLIDVAGWRSAFIIPGAVSLLTGLALWALLIKGTITDRRHDLVAESPPSRADVLRGFGILLLTMTCMGLAFHTVQTALPKVFSLRLSAWADDGGTLGIGMLIAMVYLVAGVTQVIGGHLADRFPLKPVYLAGVLLQVPMLVLVAQMAGLPLVVAATMAVFLNASVLPAENMLIARFTPAKHRGLAYGVKFVLAFATAPLAVMLVSSLVERSGEFVGVFMITAGLLALAFLFALGLPGKASSGSIASQPKVLAPMQTG